jgi:hypothetical protein
MTGPVRQGIGFDVLESRTPGFVRPGLASQPDVLSIVPILDKDRNTGPSNIMLDNSFSSAHSATLLVADLGTRERNTKKYKNKRKYKKKSPARIARDARRGRMRADMTNVYKSVIQHVHSSVPSKVEKKLVSSLNSTATHISNVASEERTRYEKRNSHQRFCDSMLFVERLCFFDINSFSVSFDSLRGINHARGDIVCHKVKCLPDCVHDPRYRRISGEITDISQSVATAGKYLKRSCETYDSLSHSHFLEGMHRLSPRLGKILFFYFMFNRDEVPSYRNNIMGSVSEKLVSEIEDSLLTECESVLMQLKSDGFFDLSRSAPCDISACI